MKKKYHLFLVLAFCLSFDCSLMYCASAVCVHCTYSYIYPPSTSTLWFYSWMEQCRVNKVNGKCIYLLSTSWSSSSFGCVPLAFVVARRYSHTNSYLFSCIIVSSTDERARFNSKITTKTCWLSKRATFSNCATKSATKR